MYFYRELSGIAPKCNLGTQEWKLVRDISIFNMRNKDADVKGDIGPITIVGESEQLIGNAAIE